MTAAQTRPPTRTPPTGVGTSWRPSSAVRVPPRCSASPGSTPTTTSPRHAQAFLRTAGRKYTDEEQRELEAEFHPQGARNLPTDDELEGTHYLLGL